MGKDPWLGMKEPEIRRKLTYDPVLRNVKIIKGSILADKNKSKLFRYEAINEISKELSRQSYEKGKISALKNKFGMKKSKAVEILDALKEKRMDKWEILKHYKRVRKEVDGYITPTIEKDIIKNIETGRKDIKQIIKDAKRAQVLYHRRVASGFTDYAEEMQEGRFSNRVDRVSSALERTLTTEEEGNKTKITSANLGIRRAETTTSALNSKGVQQASAVDTTKAQSITRKGPDPGGKKSQGVPGSINNPPSGSSSSGGLGIPLST